MQFETLRLYGAVVEIPKYTNLSPQTLLIGGKQHTIPSETLIWLNSASVHSQPQHWGSDSLLWRPTRWFTSKVESEIGAETIQEPPKGTFVPWSAGARVCPGHKFAKIEFVAVMAALFRNARVRPALLQGENSETAKERVLKTVENSKVLITLQMLQPDKVPLIWTRVK